MKYVIALLISLSFSYLGCKASDFGTKLGATIQFGTHIQRIGLSYQLYFSDNFYQINQGASFYFNKKELGPNIPCRELQFFGGFQCGFNNSSKKIYFINEYTRVSPKESSIGYLFRYYYNNINTCQATGEILFTSKHWSFILQNDILGFIKGHQDKYRTGAFAFLYTENNRQYTIETTMWTGNCSKAKKYKNTDYPSRYGYKDLRDAPYGKFSHGILGFRFDCLGSYNQSYYSEIGIDAEQIRHLFQNRLIHDMIIRRKNSKFPGNPHVPMLQNDGTPYLFQETQEVRSAKPFIQAGVNGYFFY